MSRAQPRLSIEEFGKQLLETGDLDPVYIALHKMELPEAQLARWLIAYWCMYHVGSACYLSELEGRDFWMGMRDAAANEVPAPTGGRWPRGSERRHWRGEQARKANGELMGRYLTDPVELITHLSTPDPVLTVDEHAGCEKHHLYGTTPVLPFRVVNDRALGIRSFGPWISFKVADMLDRLDIVPVSFDNASVFMFKDPRQAALMLAREKAGLPATASFKDEDKVISQVVDYLVDHFKDYTAPPLHDRPVGLQEVETILCKWKSHVNGHYPFQKDTLEYRDALFNEWSKVSKTAALMFSCMPAARP